VSLLLEALKKAELAKQQAAGDQQAEPPPAVPAEPGSGLSLEPQVGASAGKPVMTRDRLPDITQPLEIFSEDLAPRGRPGATPGPAPEAGSAAPSPPAPATERPASSAQAGQDAERASARQLFESKAGDYEPRRPFYLLIGALGVVTLGVVGYFAYQVIAPRPSFYTGPPGGKPPPPAPTVAAAAPATPITPAPAASPAATQATPATPSAAQAAVAQAAAVPVPPQPAPSGPVVRPTAPRVAGAGAAPAARPSTAAGAAGEPALRPAATPRPQVKITSTAPRVDPSVERGWEALQAGDLARAKDEYTRALRANPLDRDALLGLAAIDARNQDFASAEARYLQVLQIDPRDAYAQAALINLRGAAGDAVQSESRLKTMIAHQPDSAVLSFTLGNQYASQRRWPEAQQAYFSAVSADPEHPDYAYNLAVSLDQMRQPKLALEYYQRALALAGNRPVGFNTAQVHARIRDLQR
jgi:Tfp pilus assembly protein PilF